MKGKILLKLNCEASQKNAADVSNKDGKKVQKRKSNSHIFIDGTIKKVFFIFEFCGHRVYFTYKQ